MKQIHNALSGQNDKEGTKKGGNFSFYHLLLQHLHLYYLVFAFVSLNVLLEDDALVDGAIDGLDLL